MKTNRRQSIREASGSSGAAGAVGSAGTNGSGMTRAPRPSADEISRRAYEYWQQDGEPHGRDQEHWLRAEEELGRAARGR